MVGPVSYLIGIRKCSRPMRCGRGRGSGRRSAQRERQQVIMQPRLAGRGCVRVVERLDHLRIVEQAGPIGEGAYDLVQLGAVGAKAGDLIGFILHSGSSAFMITASVLPGKYQLPASMRKVSPFCRQWSTRAAT